MADNFTSAKEGILSGVLSDAPAGESASAQTEGETMNPHTSKGHPDSHVDSTEATKGEDGSISFSKGHSSEGVND